MLDGIIDFMITGVLVTAVILLLLVGIGVMGREDADTAGRYLGASRGILEDVNALRGNPALTPSLFVLAGLLALALVLKAVRKVND